MLLTCPPAGGSAYWRDRDEIIQDFNGELMATYEMLLIFNFFFVWFVVFFVFVVKNIF